MNTTNSRYSLAFPNPKPILGMLHLSGGTAAEKLEIAKQELADLRDGGVDAVVVENYFGDKDDVRSVLEWLEGKYPDLTVGVNVLHDHRMAFELARQFRINFIQMDSVAGHLEPVADADFAEELQALRGQVDAALLGGVRFKYQPVNSGRSEAEDLLIGQGRCDAFVVTGAATGEETDIAKVERFRSVVGNDFPLLIGAGMTVENAAAQLAVADGAIVGSYFKDTHVDTGRVLAAHVQELMHVVETARSHAAPREGVLR